MVDLLKALMMERNYKFNIKASKYPTWKTIVEKTLAKYYVQIAFKRGDHNTYLCVSSHHYMVLKTLISCMQKSC
jgi:hypothetical protein